MYAPHPLIDTPPDEARIWRYLDFTKFVALLESRALHFARGDKFEDRYEAAVPVADLAEARAYFARALDATEIDIEGVSRFRRDEIRPYLRALLGMSEAEIDAVPDAELPRHMLRVTSRFVYMSCWHLNEVESAGMWDLYAQIKEGVAVQSTVGALKRALQPAGADEAVYIGRVRYLDYERESWGTFTPLSQTFHKRRSFEHERELRAVAVNPRHSDSRATTWLEMPVDLQVLVEKLYVSPRAAGWVGELVRSVAQRYGLAVPIEHSSLYREPTF